MVDAIGNVEVGAEVAHQRLKVVDGEGGAASPLEARLLACLDGFHAEFAAKVSCAIQVELEVLQQALACLAVQTSKVQGPGCFGCTNDREYPAEAMLHRVHLKLALVLRHLMRHKHDRKIQCFERLQDHMTYLRDG